MIPEVGDAVPAAFVVAVVLLALLVYDTFARKSGASSDAWDRFTMLAGERLLSDEEQAALSAWARRAQLEDPSLVLVDRGVFDRWVRDRVAHLDVQEGHAPGTPAREGALKKLALIRKKLGHEPLPPPAKIVSSRDLLPGVRVTVRPDAPSAGASPKARLSVARVDEEAIELAAIDGDPGERTFYDAARSGRGAWATFGRPGEATYRFRTRFLDRPSVSLPGLVLAHGEFLVKEERRKTPRVLFKAPVRITLVDGDASRAFAGESVDISWGGLALVASVDVAAGSRLAMAVPLGEKEEPVSLTARVVGSSQGEGGRILNVQFVDMTPTARTRLQVFLGSGKHLLKASGARPASS